MRCFSMITGNITTGINLNRYPHTVDVKSDTLTDRCTLRLLTGEDWDIDYFIHCIDTHTPYDILLYGYTCLKAGDSVTQFLPEDCFLIELDTRTQKPLRSHGDQSMPVAVAPSTALYICYADQTVIQIQEQEFLLNIGGKPKLMTSADLEQKRHQQQTEDAVCDRHYVLEF